MSIETRKAMVEVGQETVPSAVNANTILFAFDNVTGLMQPVLPSALPVSISAQAESDTKATLQNADISVTVGAGGDYTTINAALEFLTKKYPTYKQGGVTATINLLSGFVMTEQVIVKGVDLGWITITGVDAETVVNIPSLTDITDPSGTSFGGGVFAGWNCTLPTINQLFNIASGTQVVAAVFLVILSKLSICAGSGAKNVCNYGIRLDRGSNVTAKGAILTGFAQRNVQCGSSIADIEGADITNGGDYGVSCSYGGTVNADGANATGAGTAGFRVVLGGTIAADSATGTLSPATANDVTSAGIIFQ